ncbi:hypothetical protein ACSBRB_07085 [Staphylococcus auricularis]|uniref:hypothetical protein n=1 Tax=Staphylococcus auricularis TaxID=29379 RepID=UPI003EBFD79B
MMNNQQPSPQFEQQFEQERMYRSNRTGKKKRSWISLIIQIIVFVLVAITGYSMYREPIVNLVFADQPINFTELTKLQDTINQASELNFNLSDIDQLQTSIDRLIIVFYVFFIACIISLIFTVITAIFNRTALKALNIFTLAIMLVITFFFSMIIQRISSHISNELTNYYITVKPEQILAEADAIHNSLILLGCSIALLFISLFFKNRRRRVE